MTETVRSGYSMLLDRLDDDPTAPWVTDVDPTSGERAELSVTSMVNTIAKVAHLVGTLPPAAHAPTRVAVPLPPRWHSVALLLGCWGAGALTVLGDAADLTDVDAVVLGPDTAADPPGTLPDTVWATRLHPLGLPFDEPPAFPVDDLAPLLRSQPDQPPPDRSHLDQPAAWLPAKTVLTHAELASLATELDAGLDPEARVLSTLPLTTLAGLVIATTVPTRYRRSLVLARSATDPAALARLCAVEAVTTTAGVDVAGLPRLD